MGTKKKVKVFVSYSRHDEALIKPLSAFIGVGANDAVFLDVTSLKPGDRWEDKILGAVAEAPVFVLCWCCNGAQSSFISKEVNAALADQQKRVVPVMLCPAELPASVADRQWIDLRGQIVHKCCVDHSQPAPANAVEEESYATQIGEPPRQAPCRPSPVAARPGIFRIKRPKITEYDEMEGVAFRARMYFENLRKKGSSAGH